MSSHIWSVTEHVIPASHIRGFHRGIRDESSAHLRLAVKQYVPLSNPNPQPGDITLIMAQGVGNAKSYTNHYLMIFSAGTYPYEPYEPQI